MHTMNRSNNGISVQKVLFLEDGTSLYKEFVSSKPTRVMGTREASVAGQGQEAHAYLGMPGPWAGAGRSFSIRQPRAKPGRSFSITV